MALGGIAIVLGALVASAAPGEAVRVPIGEAREVDAAELVASLAKFAGVAVDRPAGTLGLPVDGLPGALTRKFLSASLGPEVAFAVDGREFVVDLPAALLGPGRRPEFDRRLRDLARRVGEEARWRSKQYGMHPRDSYRPNDPARPTVCLVHGLNSTAQVFVHMIGPLEAAGFGVVLYDFPYNRDIDASARAFGRDWATFRKGMGERRPWSIVSHSMGGLLARWYVEADPAYAKDVSRLIQIAPPNHGSDLAGAQALLQLIQGLQAVNGQRARALARLSDGLGAAADDLTPGSAFLRDLDGRPRREGVRYHILAGDAGPLSVAARGQVEAQMVAISGGRGLLGGLARRAAGDLRTRLDELTEGLGDGCVAVASTRLDGVIDHETIHANHLELIRAPWLFPNAGPVVCMPFVLRALGHSAGLPGASRPAAKPGAGSGP